jgi:hypothetical protein
VIAIGCGCGGGSNSSAFGFKVMVPGEEPVFTLTRAEANILRSAQDKSYTVVVMQVTRSIAEAGIAAAAQTAVTE